MLLRNVSKVCGVSYRGKSYGAGEAFAATDADRWLVDSGICIVIDAAPAQSDAPAQSGGVPAGAPSQDVDHVQASVGRRGKG